MTLPFAFTAADRRLLPEGRAAGPMPWVIAIMVFLTVLAAAAGLALASSARALGDQIAGRVTIQIVEADRVARDQQAEAAARTARALPDVRDVTRVSDAEIAQLLEPWLGPGGLELPAPALVDVDLAVPAALPRLKTAVARVAPSARVDAHAQALAPLRDLVGALRWLAGLLVLLMGVATAACVVLAARAALNTHRETIDVLHLLGATDIQIARLFQRRIALDALFGGGLGFAAGALVLILLAGRIGAVGSELVGSVRLEPAGWLALVAVPMAGALLATAAARLTVERALRRSL
ncbi:cell division protein [Sphingomonas sp. MAH-20]|uniref:Cell division protein n=1 Tax=Sphingomonas horti TaxID=2682842 RepID=A0A6I4IZG8_9SPHN|nr:FtsX-like permease family protein [Sphingomonas sp. CGMCC 1.13658]MBA2920629.1 cell division protein [Sphingomonas sp. CGMCC 1.13658]MVO77565.1 cell division protein [Sphingomonas horti]